MASWLSLLTRNPHYTHRLTLATSLYPYILQISPPKSTMNQVNNITIKFMDVPAELLLDILGHLDVYDLVRARRVRRVFFAQIATNAESPGMQ